MINSRINVALLLAKKLHKPLLGNTLDTVMADDVEEYVDCSKFSFILFQFAPIWKLCLKNLIVYKAVNGVSHSPKAANILLLDVVRLTTRWDERETTRMNARLRGWTRDYEDERETTRMNVRLRGWTRDYEDERKTTRMNARLRGAIEQGNLFTF